MADQMADERLMQALSDAGAQCGNCGDAPGDRNCPDCEQARGWYVEAARSAGWDSRADVLREVQDATVAWLERKAAEERGVARQEEERRATARARAHRERADLISTLASKAARGAVREFLAATPPQPTPAEVLADAADRIAARAAQLGGEWLRVDQVCDALRRLGTDPAPSTDTTEAGGDRG